MTLPPTNFLFGIFYHITEGSDKVNDPGSLLASRNKVGLCQGDGSVMG